ncbi:hypothetical protein GDO81_019396 [Engystomops pustulosus]|uniref:Uncharacterized protein n=1 Tax=Engystomops pustulosus TaxID=76066 RepID=A0AAV6ZLE7_ENGPU|nr:hypothetical protein GDO81_019396 [Engystomops pustulosus]
MSSAPRIQCDPRCSGRGRPISTLTPSQPELRHITNPISSPQVPAAARKGRTKKEARENTNRDSPCGHERKIVDKLQRTEAKRKSKPNKD